MPRWIELHRVTFAYSGEPILSDVSVRFLPGWTGLVGANGSGKSTLAALLCGALAPGSGRVSSEPARLALALVPQSVEAPAEGVLELARRADRAAGVWRSCLSLVAHDLERWPTLSPGERKRWQIAAALSREPDALVLDEPDAHLDAEGRERVLAALRRYRGVGVLISHRRDVLEALAERTVVLEGRRARCFDCGVTQAREELQQERRSIEQERRHVRAERDRVRTAEAELRARQRGAERDKNAGVRMKSPKDSDARGIAQSFAASRAADALARRVAASTARRGRLEAELRAAPLRREVGAALTLRAGTAGGARLAALVVDEVRAGSKRLLARTSLTLERGARVRLAGANGSGKSTLLSLLAQRAGPSRAFHLPQSLAERERREAVAEVRRLPPRERGAALCLLAALGSEPERVLASALPSAGEAKKLRLACALSAEPAALLLDEPTNDLDLPTCERLERALAAYPGAVVLVTHDDALANALTRQTWTLRDGRVDVA